MIGHGYSLKPMYDALRLRFFAPLTTTNGVLYPLRGLGAGTFSRASAQYITDFEGVTRKVESESVAVEGSRVVMNLLTYSEDFSNAAWAYGRASYTDGLDAPPGITASKKILDSNVSGTHRIYSNSNEVSSVANKKFRVSIYAKAGEYSRCELALANNIETHYHRVSFNLSGISAMTTFGTGTYSIQPLSDGWFRLSVTGTVSSTDTIARIFFYLVNNENNRSWVGDGTKGMYIAGAQIESVDAIVSTSPGEYVKTTSAAVTKCFSTTNGNTVDVNGVVTEATGTSLPTSYPERVNTNTYGLNDRIQVAGWWYQCTTLGISAGSAPTFPQGKAGTQTVTDGSVVWTIGGRLLLGYVSEPASSNKVTAYGIIPADTLGSELSSGTLTIGQKYQITARTDADFTADGAANNVVGTQFVATAATVTLNAGDKVKRVQWGVGEKSFHNGSSFVQNITGLTLGGDVAAVLSIVTDETEITKAGLAGINPGYKVYKLDNSAGSTEALVSFTGAPGNTNAHMESLVSRASAGTGRLRAVSGAVPYTDFTSSAYNRLTYAYTPADSSLSLAAIRAENNSVLYFLLPQLEELPYVTSINPSAGSTSTRAATVLSYPVSGNLTSPLWSAKLTATPAAASQDGKYLLGSYYDANNGVGLLMSGANAVARKRLGGSNNDATKALTLAAGTTNRFGLRGSGAGWSVFVDGTKGTDDADTTTPVAGTTIQIGLDGNSGNGFNGYFRDLYLYNKPLADGRF